MSNKLEFEVMKDGKKITLYAIKPSIEIEQKAVIQYAKSFAELSNSGAIFRERLKSIITEQKLWDEKKQKELDEIDARLQENVKLLPDANGKVYKKGLKLSELRKAALEIRMDRARRVRLLEPITRLDNATVEGLAEDARFNFLISQCIVDEFKKPYFASYDDYVSRGYDLDAKIAANKFHELMYGDLLEIEKQFPENDFLLKHKMCDDSLALVDKAGKYVDVDGNSLEDNTNEDKEKNEFEVEDDWV